MRWSVVMFYRTSSEAQGLITKGFILSVYGTVGIQIVGTKILFDTFCSHYTGVEDLHRNGTISIG